MALQTIKGGGLLLPHRFGLHRQDLTIQGLLIDAAGEKAAYIFQVPKTGTIDRVGFRVRDVTTSQTLRAGLETVDATTGFPTGTQYGGSAVVTQASPAGSTFYELTLGTAATATAGDMVALVIQFDATVGSLTVSQLDGVGGSQVGGIPYSALFTAAWAKSSTIPIMSLRYNDASYEFIGVIPLSNPFTPAFNSGSTPDEIGNYFTLPASVRASGVYALATPTGDFDIVLYEGSTVLRTINVDTNVTGGTSLADHFLRFSTPVTLSASTIYRIVFKPITVTNITIKEFAISVAGMMDMLPGGTDWHKTSRTDAGSWTQDTLRRVWGLGLLIDQIDDGISGATKKAGDGGGFAG